MTSSASPSFTPFKSPLSVFNPTTLFIAASVGIHALILWFILPNFRNLSSSKPENPSDNVAVIELNEAEQSRLPDLAPQSLDINDFNLPNLSDTPPNATSSIELDPSRIQASIPNLPAPPPSLPPLDYSNSIPITLTPPSIRSISPRSIPIPPSAYRNYRTNPPSLANTPSLPDFSTQQTRPEFPQLREPIPADELINRKYNLPELPENSPEVAVNSPNAAEDFPNQQPVNSEAIRAQRLQEERVRRLVAETQQKVSGLRYDGENTSSDEAMRNNVTWMSKVGEVKPKASHLVGNYPKAACRRQLQGTAVYGVSVNPQGVISQQPYLIQSSGYGILNQQALQQVTATRFENTTGQVQPYRVSVNFQYNDQICPSVSIVNPSPQQPVQAPVKPETTSPKPAPEAIRRAPQPVQPNPPAAIRRTPQPVQPKPIQENPPAAIREVPQPVQPKPIQENPPAAIREVPQPVQPKPIQENPPAAIREVPQPVQPKPTQDNQPPAPSAVRKAPAQPVQPKPTQNNQPPAPSAVRKAPAQPIQPIQPKPTQDNQPPAPSAVRKAPAPSVQAEATPMGEVAPRK